MNRPVYPRGACVRRRIIFNLNINAIMSGRQKNLATEFRSTHGQSVIMVLRLSNLRSRSQGEDGGNENNQSSVFHIFEPN